MSPNAVAEAAQRFLRSRHPSALLSLPGCSPLAISPSHWNTLELRFPGAENLLVRSVEEFEATIRWVTSGDASRIPEARLRALMAAECYCAKVQSILALRLQDCVHEGHFTRFRDYRGALLFQSGWEFNLLSSGPTRWYRVLRTHSRLLLERKLVTLDQGEGVMEVRFIPSRHLFLVVDGMPSQTHWAGRIVIDRIPGAELVVLSPLEAAVDDDDIAVYRLLDNYLDRAQRNPSLSREILNEAAKAAAQSAHSDYPVREVINSILDSSEGALTPDGLNERIVQTRARLWDAPFIARQARELLNANFTAGMPRAVRVSGLPLAVEADLNDLTMLLPKIEHGDRYLRVAS